jgi:ParB-like chromosome segregation protein Spo0J
MPHSTTLTNNKDLLKPVANVQVVNRTLLKPNDYNPNKVLKQNLELLKESILSNGWTLPIVVRPDYTIIDGFHRWLIAGQEPLLTLLEGKVPIVVVEHENEAGDMFGTITHNRARGTHLLEPMEKIVQKLIAEGKNTKDIAEHLGMKEEEIFRLSGFDRDDFLKLMAGERFTQAKIYKGMA